MSTNSITMEVKIQDIEEAVKALCAISPESVLLNPEVFITRKLYTGSRLDAPEKESNNNAASAHILRKNVYYLARATRNVTLLVIQMTQRGILTLDEKDEILDTEGELLKAIRFYGTLLQQEGTNFQPVLNVLRQYENTGVADILSRYPALGDTPLAMPRALSVVQDRVIKRPSIVQKPVRPPPGEAWSCPHCTYINAPGGSICEICSKSKAGPIADTEFILDGPLEGYVTCEMCTFENSLLCRSCAVCLQPLAKKIAVAAVARPAIVDEPIDLRLSPNIDYSDDFDSSDSDESDDDDESFTEGPSGIDLRTTRP